MRWHLGGAALCAVAVLAVTAGAQSFGQPPAPAAASQAAPGTGNQPPSNPAPAGLQPEDFEQRIGPLKIKDQSFTIMLHMKRLRSSTEETVAQMQIRDAAGKVAFEESFPFQVDGDHFAETIGVSARELQGTQGSGLLVQYDSEPSTPLGGGSYQIFGLFDNKLVPFSQPIALEGTLVQPEPPPEKVVKTETEPGLQGDVIRFRVWTSYFFVMIPVRVDWLQAKVRPAWRCSQMTSKGWQPVCRYRAEVERTSPEEEMTFVRLLPEDFEPDAIAQHVVVKKTSKVEFLEAAGVLQWNEQGPLILLDLTGDLWLKVRIDGKEGWIHTPEDFSAIGLQQSG